LAKKGLQSMFTIGGLHARTRRAKSCGTATQPGQSQERFRHKSAKSLVMTYLEQFVSDGSAEWRVLEDDVLELRFVSGEVFVLADTTITRVT
jgi:hypothetical protein